MGTAATRVSAKTSQWLSTSGKNSASTTPVGSVAYGYSSRHRGRASSRAAANSSHMASTRERDDELCTADLAAELVTRDGLAAYGRADAGG